MFEERTKRKAGLGSVLEKGSKTEEKGEKAEPLDPPSPGLPSLLHQRKESSKWDQQELPRSGGGQAGNSYLFQFT